MTGPQHSAVPRLRGAVVALSFYFAACWMLLVDEHAYWGAFLVLGVALVVGAGVVRSLGPLLHDEQGAPRPQPEAVPKISIQDAVHAHSADPEDPEHQRVRFLGALGHETWFRLGDRDFAHCLHRTLRLREGMSLTQLSESLRRTHDLACRILPMTEDPAPTLVELEDGRLLHFEEYLVREKSPANVRGVNLDAARAAKPAPGVLDAIACAEIVILCPSNPVVSIGPILAVPGIRDAIEQRGAPVVAISPIIGGAPVKGPADHLLRGIGCEVSARGVAGLYRGLAQGFVFDQIDAAQLGDIEALGLRAIATQTLMTDVERSRRLAATALELALALPSRPR